MNKIDYYNSWLCKAANMVCLAVCVLALAGCNEDEANSIKEDPYAGGRAPLEVKLLSEKPSPESAGPREQVIFKASGLAKYCHPEEDTFDFDFYISDEKCKIESATDSTLTIVVPEAVSSGTTYLVLENQIFYGPYFSILGSVSIDEGFEYYKTGPYNGLIYSCVQWCGNTELTSEFYLCGDFRQEKTKPYGGIAMINNEKGLIKYGTADKIKIGRGIATGSFYDENTDEFYYPEVDGMNYWKADKESPRALIYGAFREYETYSASLGGFEFKNILLANNDLTIKTETKKFSDYTGKTYDISVPAFVGGTMMSEKIIRAFSTSDGKIIAIGNFTVHRMTDYDNTTCDANKRLLAAEILTPARSVMRMDEIGQLDKTYRRSLQNEEESLPGTTGEIKDACMLSDESLIIVGAFTSFDGKPVWNIVKLDKNGQVDDAFQSVVGGANGDINRITCTSFKDENGMEQERIVLVGSFTTFNGQPAQGMVILDAEGNPDPGFVLKELEGGILNFAKIVDLNANGETAMPHVVISGTFTKYDGITRQGFLILDMKGDAIQRFNVPGRFYGQLYDAQYSLTSDNVNGLLLTGDFSSFDGKRMNNIVMLKVDLAENTNNEP